MSNTSTNRKIPCTVEVLTRNSAKTLERCLESVKDFGEIIVLDGNSTDGTREIARRFGCAVIPQYDTAKQNVAIKDYSEVRNKGLAMAQFDWFMYIDSDEYLSKEAAEEISSIVENPTSLAQVWWQKRKYVYQDTIVDCATTYPNQQIRLFHRKWVNGFIKPIHERIEIKPGAIIGSLKKFEYLPVESLSLMKTRWQGYMEKELLMQSSATTKKKLKLILRQILLFLFFGLRYVKIILLCHGNRMPFRYEWNRHLFLLKYALALCGQIFFKTASNR